MSNETKPISGQNKLFKSGQPNIPDLGMDGKRLSTFERKISDYVSKWERRGYSDGIPDEADPVLEEMIKAPSYRAICMAILKNDRQLVTLGYNRPKSYAYMELKRIEIAERNK